MDTDWPRLDGVRTKIPLDESLGESLREPYTEQIG
jgi:hypothetical protein